VRNAILCAFLSTTQMHSRSDASLTDVESNISHSANSDQEFDIFAEGLSDYSDYDRDRNNDGTNGIGSVMAFRDSEEATKRAIDGSAGSASSPPSSTHFLVPGSTLNSPQLDTAHPTPSSAYFVASDVAAGLWKRRTQIQPSPLSQSRPPPPLPPVEPNWLSLEEIDGILRDLHATLAEWTATWGPVSYWRARMNPSTSLNTATDFRREVYDYIEYNRSKLQGLHRLAMVDFTAVDHGELRNAWRQALHLAEEVQYRVAVADSILQFQSELS
jgi:hypothetical protein